MSRLGEEAKREEQNDGSNSAAAGDANDEDDEEAKAEASKCLFSAQIKQTLTLYLLLLLRAIERQAFKAKMKGHYKNEFNAAALLR